MFEYHHPSFFKSGKSDHRQNKSKSRVPANALNTWEAPLSPGRSQCPNCNFVNDLPLFQQKFVQLVEVSRGGRGSLQVGGPWRPASIQHDPEQVSSLTILLAWLSAASGSRWRLWPCVVWHCSMPCSAICHALCKGGLEHVSGPARKLVAMHADVFLMRCCIIWSLALTLAATVCGRLGV